MGCTSAKASVGKAGEVSKVSTLLQNPSPAKKNTDLVADATNQLASASEAAAVLPANEETPQAPAEAADQVKVEAAGCDEAKHSSTESRMEPVTEDKVTKISSSVVMVNYVPSEEEEDVPALSSGQRSSKRKATPWQKPSVAAVDFDCDDEEEEEQEKEPLQRKAVRKATPWSKGAQVLDLDEEDDDEGMEAAQDITKGAAPASPPPTWFSFCTQPCKFQDQEQELVFGP